MTTEEYSFKQINTVVLALSCATNSEPAKKYRRLVRAATGPLLDMQNRADGSDKRTGHHADTSAAGRQQQRSRKQTRTVRSGLVRTHAQGGGQVRVSSSYIARICTLLNMPRPERGYWAKLAVGKAPKQPVLPEPRYGDPLEWVRDGAPPKRVRVLPRPQERQPGRKHIARPQLPDRHPLISRARPLFDVERLSYYGGYLKRTKKLLVDLAVTKTGLDKALAFANEFFLSLEARNHRVEIAPHSELFHRAQIDERENPGKGHHHNDLWSPIRCTVTYIGTVAIGLTVIEMSEEAKARYVNGECVRVINYIPKRRGRYAEDRVWTSTALSRLVASACKRTRHTRGLPGPSSVRETPGQNLSDRIPAIMRELEKVTVKIAQLVEEGERQAEVERQEWEVQKEQWRRQEEARRVAKPLKEGREELLEIIDGWAVARRLEEFFADAERRAQKSGYVARAG